MQERNLSLRLSADVFIDEMRLPAATIVERCCHSKYGPSSTDLRSREDKTEHYVEDRRRMLDIKRLA